MALILSELESEIREEAGSPTLVELSVAQIDRKVTAALVEFSGYVPYVSIKTLATVAGTQDYSVPATVVNVLEVYPSQAGAPSLDEDLPPDASLSLAGFTTRLYFEHPSLWEILQIKLRAFRKNTGVDWQFNPTTGILRLFPVPGSVENVYYLTKEDWSLATISARFRELIVLYATSKVLDLVALYRDRAAGISRAGNRLDYPSAPLRDSAKIKMAAFLDKAIGLSKEWGGGRF